MNKRTISTSRIHSTPTAQAICDALDRYFGAYSCLFSELGVDGIWSLGQSPSRMDYWAIDVYHREPTEPFPQMYAVEIKVTRNDFRAELGKPEKQHWALMRSSRFYFCAPKGLIKQNELPPYAGLLEYDHGVIYERIKAPMREPKPPSWKFVAGLLWLASARSRRYSIKAGESRNRPKSD